MSRFDTPDARRALKAKQAAFARLSEAQQRVHAIQAQLTAARREVKLLQRDHVAAVNTWLTITESEEDAA